VKIKNYLKLKKKTLSLLFIITVMISVPFITGTQRTYAETTDLKENKTQSDQVKALGLSDDQISKKDSSGKEINKSKSNPLGGDKVTLNRTLELAISGIADRNDYNFGDVYKKPLDNGFLGLKQNPVEGNIYGKKSWFNKCKSMIGADVTGTGKQSVVVSYLTPLPKNRMQLHVSINYYNSIPSEEKDFYIADVDNPVSEVRDSNIKSAAVDLDKDGIDEIGIVVNKSLYICDPNANGSNILVSQTTFDSNSSITNILASTSNRVAMDIGSGDSDGDGYNELLVTTGTANGGYVPKLLIYDGMDANHPTAAIDLKTDSITYLSASVDVGDILGDGSKYVVIGGKISSSKAAISYLQYDATKSQYSSQLINSQTWQLSDDITFFSNPLLGLKCASLDVLKTGNPEYVVLGGFVYQYNNNTLQKQEISSYSKYGPDNRYSPNSVSNSKNNIVNINFNKEKDRAYINNIIVGNFDGNKEGKEQIIMVDYYYHKGYDYDVVYISWCGMDKSSKLNSHLQSVWDRKDQTKNYFYPAICGVDIYNSGQKLEYEESKSIFTFSNPSIIAVIGATPYYDELSNKYGALGNVGTTYGSETETGSSKSDGVSAHVGVSFGYSQDIGFLGIKIGDISMKTQIENTFTNTWTNSKSITKSIKYTTYYNEDSVVVMVVPYDIFYYKVTDEAGKVTEMSINVPYTPITKIMPVKDYNKIAKNIKNAPVIDDNVLKHKIGDPRSYPKSTDGLSNINNQAYAEAFTTGTGNTSTEQSITTKETKSKSFDYSLNVDVAFNFTLFGASAGTNVGAGYNTSVTSESSNAQLCSGSVAGIPSDYERYSFKWCLTTYKYKLAAGNSEQQFIVVSYLVKPLGKGFPARVATNLRVISDTKKLNATAIQWDKTEDAAGYIVARSTDLDNNYIEVARLNNGNSTTYTDTSIKYGTTYYYEVTAYSTSEGMPTDALQVNGLKVTNINVKQQPKLFYTEEDSLDLSNLMVSLAYSDGTSNDISCNDFNKNNLTINKAKGTALKTSDTGTYLTVTYVPENLTTRTGNLIVNAEAFYDFTVDVAFKIGSKEKATKLEPNQILAAQVAIRNNLTTDKQVMVIVALYDSKGTMINGSFQS